MALKSLQGEFQTTKPADKATCHLVPAIPHANNPKVQPGRRAGSSPDTPDLT